MLQLPFNNHCSTPAVSPKNWQKPSADVSRDWFIQYRFYTPENSKGKLVVVKTGINTFKTWKERKSVAIRLLKEINETLLNGYNPIIGTYIEPVTIENDISPEAPVCKAFTAAMHRLKIEDNTRKDIGNILVHIEKAAIILGFDRVKIQDIRKRHIKLILENVGLQKGEKWTANTFNHYRKYLSILFKELVELDAIELNPIAGIAKQKTIKKIKQILTLEERKIINSFLHDNHYRFWIFLQIFFHSGSRCRELMKLKGKDVDLEKQQFKVTVIKGSFRREVLKTLKDVALPFWRVALEGCNKEDYIFSKGIKPGSKMIAAIQIPRRWRTHVKGIKDKDGNLIGGLGITADFNSLRHLHSDQVASLLTLEEAGRHNSHTSTKTTLIYAVNEEERKADRVRKLGNEF